MAATVQCPRCGKDQTVEVDKAGKEITCRVCYHAIAIGAGKTAERAKPAAKDRPSKVAESAITKEQPTPLTAKKPPPTDAVSPRRSRRDVEDEDDDDDLPRRRRRPVANSSSGMTGVLIGAGIFVVATLLCGGAGVGFLFLIPAPRPADVRIVFFLIVLPNFLTNEGAL